MTTQQPIRARRKARAIELKSTLCLSRFVEFESIKNPPGPRVITTSCYVSALTHLPSHSCGHCLGRACGITPGASAT
eukprot:3133612-Rhodomonas_salina.5